MNQTIIATTPEEVAELKAYLYKHYPVSKYGSRLDELSGFSAETEYLWIYLEDGLIESHQTAYGYKGSERDRIIEEYFTDDKDAFLLKAFLHPDDYPEYYI